METSSSYPERKKTDALPLLGLSLATFGLGLYGASRQIQKKQLSISRHGQANISGADEGPIKPPVVQARPFNAYLYGFKALGIATAIVGVTAICTVSLTTWYLDVHNVHSQVILF